MRPVCEILRAKASPRGPGSVRLGPVVDNQGNLLSCWIGLLIQLTREGDTARPALRHSRLLRLVWYLVNRWKFGENHAIHKLWPLAIEGCMAAPNAAARCSY
jgi:hypothetical protein